MVLVHKLDNGIRVALEEISYVRSIALGIWVKNGSRNERPEENGVSHYLEHMMFKGTQTRTGRQIAEEMDMLGGQINAYTTKEYTCFYTRVLDKHFSQSLEVVADMLHDSLFASEEVDKERNVITEEIFMYEDAPEELVFDALQDAIWRDSSLGVPILGTEESIAGITSESMRDYFERNYHSENTVLSVAGNFKAEEMLQALNTAFGKKTSKYPYAPNDTVATYHQTKIAIEKEIGQVHTCLAFPGLVRDHEMKYALSVFNTIFGGGMSSRLFQNIREEKGYTYSIYSLTTSFEDTGLFSIYAGMNPQQMEAVFKLVAHEIKDLKKNPISKKLIDVTKEQMISSFIMGTESTLNRMNSAGASMLLRNEIQSVEEVIDKISQVRVEDMERVVDMVFNMDEISYSAVGNIKDINVEEIVQNAFLS